MSCRKMALGLVASGLVTVLAASMAFAQTPPAPGGPGGGGRPGRGGNFMAGVMDNIKTTLAVTDDEWTVLQPKVQKVMDLAASMRPQFGGGRGRGGRGGGGGGAPATDTAAPAVPASASDLTEKTTALRTTLENKDADPKDIAQKLAAVRDSRERVKADLVKAQAELKELLTPRQEAQLALYGLID